MQEQQSKLVFQLVNQVIKLSAYTQVDTNYLVNRVLAIVGDAALAVPAIASDCPSEMVDALVDASTSDKTQRQIKASQLQDLLTPAPSRVNEAFWTQYQLDKKAAIATFYALMKQNNYIQTKAIAKNEVFCCQTDYGNLEITINLSKPEKDPKAIAAALTKTQTDYPKCQLCAENEGYLGRLNHPARSNLRIINFELKHHPWGFQYSPYAYFNEHAIFLDKVHHPMKINAQTFANLLEIIQKFPGYFAGSNADLPIVGGSILTHEHYQGGRHHFAMEQAKPTAKIIFENLPKVAATIVKWPMSVIRLTSADEGQLVKAAAKILASWQQYSDESVDVRAFTTENGKTQKHHTITPIARTITKENTQLLQLDLVLRDNQTNAKYPLGIFHPHEEYWHIKKENIGLIEVMGLAILPPRLKTELADVAKFLCGEVSLDKVKPSHQPWAKTLKLKHPDVTDEKLATTIVRQAVGNIFAHVLEDAGVFKQSAAGQAAFLRFVAQINGVKTVEKIK